MHDACRRGSVARDVSELQLLALDDRALHGIEVLGRPAATGRLVPAHRVEDDRGGRCFGRLAKRRRECAHELAERRLHFGCGRRSSGDEEQRAGFGCVEAAQVGAPAAREAPSAVATGLGVHRYAGHPEGFEVAPGGAFGYFELGGHLGRGHLTPRLQQEEGGNQPVGAHDRIFLYKAVTRWPL